MRLEPGNEARAWELRKILGTGLEPGNEAR